MIYETPYGKVLINVLDNDNMTLRLSGGADSAILLYLLCLTAIKENKKNNVFPISAIKDGREHILDNINNILSFIEDTFKTHIESGSITINKTIHEKALDWLESDVSLAIQNKLCKENIIKYQITSEFNGVTANPMDPKFKSIEETLKSTRAFNRDINEPFNVSLPDRTNTKMIDSRVSETVSIVHNHKNYSWKPFRNQDKRIPMYFYKQFNLNETLLNLTRSCEDLKKKVLFLLKNVKYADGVLKKSGPMKRLINLTINISLTNSGYGFL